MGAIFGAKIPFADHCGIEFLGADNGATRLRVVVDERHGNNSGIPHGGLIATLLDVAMGTAARLATDAAAVITLDMHVSFVAPGDAALTAEGRVVRAGGSIVFAEAEARGATGQIVAKASGIFKARKAKGE